MHQFGVALGAAPAPVAAFVAAWRRLYRVTLLLDHLQDGDALEEDWLATLPPAVQYHLAFSAYVEAQRSLAVLDTQQVPPATLVQLQQLWAASVAQLAAGQYRDLTLSPQELAAQPAGALDAYEEIAAGKTGASFGLAFGGVALLATDDDALVTAATNAGLTFGMLLQYHDDLCDAAEQSAQPDTLTLGRALLAAQPPDAGQLTAEIFWQLIYAHYARSLAQILAPLPPAAQQIIWTLLDASFGPPPILPDTGPMPGAAQ
jgi:hypothetical protein